MSDSLRHPEKSWRPSSAVQRKPAWIRSRAPTSPEFFEMKALVRRMSLKTVCEEASCPNIGECWRQKHVTTMILGSVCTRGCAFCNVATGRPGAPDPHEPERIGQLAANLALSHIVVTSVDRDDLEDGGAEHFALTIRAIRELSPRTTIEVLTPDFLRKDGALEIVVAARPDVFNHNVETVPRLYRTVRPGARYFSSLSLLKRAKELDSSIFTKSGMMVGLGEQRDEILQVMDDLRVADVDFLTIGQYLQPTPKHHPVERYLPPEEFEQLKSQAAGKGFSLVSASPLTRSSHNAGADFLQLKAAKIAAGPQLTRHPSHTRA